jgi:hypothetical protein
MPRPPAKVYAGVMHLARAGQLMPMCSLPELVAQIWNQKMK